VAAVTVAVDAAAARVEAERLRIEAQFLRAAARRNAVVTRSRKQTALDTKRRLQASRIDSLPSPWSPLPWVPTDGTLEQTLVPLS
jgi:hypothetical protein